jgi:hypothetical protein
MCEGMCSACGVDSATLLKRFAAECSLVSPEIFESCRRKLRVANRMLNVLVSEIVLNRSRVVPIVCELIAAGVAKHVRMNGEA